jgi:AhpD family alkylhydroperoxidase
MGDTAAFRHDQIIPEVYKGFLAGEMAVRTAGISSALKHLIYLRVSQINDCAYCVTMHSQEARADGETNERLDRLIVWRHVEDFTAAERAALAWAEALTKLPVQQDLAPLRGALRDHFTDRQASAITAAIAQINLWNRLGVSGH